MVQLRVDVIHTRVQLLGPYARGNRHRHHQLHQGGHLARCARLVPIEDFIIASSGSERVAGASRFLMREDDYRPIDLTKALLLYAALGWDAASIARFEGVYSAVWRDPMDETLRPSGTWTIECVAVPEQARGLGVGKRLMRYIVEQARAAGVDSVGVSVTPGNDKAERLYLSAGFQPYITYFSEYYYGQFPGTEKFRLRLG